MSGYSVYIGKCLLPIAPQRIEAVTKTGNMAVRLIDGDEIEVLGKAGLRTIFLEFIIPQVRYPFAVYSGGFKGAKYFLDYFKELSESGRPFQFISIRRRPNGETLFSENIKVCLEELKVSEQAGLGSDIKAEMKLREYKEKSLSVFRGSIGEAGYRAAPPRRISSTVNRPIVIGSEIIVNGRLYGSSYGDAPGQMRNNYRGVVNFINLKGSHPYHIASAEGGWLGWVDKASVRLI